uniref:Exonuclease domain-containing protein n=1 Tax=Alexandrium monilatum TaxID=311494 RepID=A0A7S4UPV6_9DINO
MGLSNRFAALEEEEDEESEAAVASSDGETEQPWEATVASSDEETEQPWEAAAASSAREPPPGEQPASLGAPARTAAATEPQQTEAANEAVPSAFSILADVLLTPGRRAAAVASARAAAAGLVGRAVLAEASIHILIQTHMVPFRNTLTGPRYDLFCIVDFECTCDEVSKNPHEIIEFPGVFLNARTLCVEFEFHSFVRPTEHPRLTAFCTELTGIEQRSVDEASSLECVLCDFEHFCVEHNLKPGRQLWPGFRNFCVATDGPWDVRNFLQPECERKRILGFSSSTWQNVVNVRRHFRERFGLPSGGVKDMLAKVGLEFEGREHSGLADSRNIARLLAVLIADGLDVSHNLEVPFKRR